MALFQAYSVQNTAWRSATLQNVRQNRSPALSRMGTEFGCKICTLLQTSVSKDVPGRLYLSHLPITGKVFEPRPPSEPLSGLQGRERKGRWPSIVATQMQSRFRGVQKCLKTLPRTKSPRRNCFGAESRSKQEAAKQSPSRAIMGEEMVTRLMRLVCTIPEPEIHVVWTCQMAKCQSRQS